MLIGIQTYFLAHQSLEMKEPSFPEGGVGIKSESAEKASEVQNEKPYATRMPKISSPIRELLKSGENSRKRQRTGSDVAKSALQRKMYHLDKEKERRYSGLLGLLKDFTD